MRFAPTWYCDNLGYGRLAWDPTLSATEVTREWVASAWAVGPQGVRPSRNSSTGVFGFRRLGFPPALLGFLRREWRETSSTNMHLFRPGSHLGQQARCAEQCEVLPQNVQYLTNETKT